MAERKYYNEAFRHGRRIETPPDYGRASQILNRLAEITNISRETLEPQHYVHENKNAPFMAFYAPIRHTIHYNGAIDEDAVEHERFHALQNLLGGIGSKISTRLEAGSKEPVATIADSKGSSVYRFNTGASIVFWGLLLGAGYTHAVVTEPDFKKMLAKIGCYTCAGIVAPYAGAVKRWWKSKNLRKFAQTATDDELMAVIMAKPSGPFFPGMVIKKLEKQGMLKNGSFTGKAKVKIEGMAPAILKRLELNRGWRERTMNDQR